MLLSFSVVMHAVLLVAGALWCRAILARLPQDLDEFRLSDDTGERAAIAFFWAVTAAILCVMSIYIIGLLRGVLA